jgi:imidazolonepropionase-like amidohydrolase
VGTIAAGMAADFVLLDGDPLQDIRNTRRIAVVVKDGVVVGARE